MELLGIEPEKEREQLWPEMKEKPEMLDSCYNTVRSNVLPCVTSKLCRLQEGTIVRAASKTRFMAVTVLAHCK